METVYFQNGEEFKNLTLQTSVQQYKLTGDEFYLRAILYKLKGTINYYLYFKTDYQDKHALLALYEDILMLCLETYDINGTASFATYYSKCLSNRLANFIKANQEDYLSLDLDYSSEGDSSSSESSSLGNLIEDDTNDMVNTESNMLLESLKDKLDDNEYRVCKVILSDNHNLTHTEIAKEIGLTTQAIKNIFVRLQKRFKTYGVFINNF